jgi:hypothetical protein
MILYRPTDCHRRRGGAVGNLAHHAALRSGEKTAPAIRGIKHPEYRQALRLRGSGFFYSGVAPEIRAISAQRGGVVAVEAFSAAGGPAGR